LIARFFIDRHSSSSFIAFSFDLLLCAGDHSATDAVIAAKKSSKLSLQHYLASPKNCSSIRISLKHPLFGH